MKKLRILFVIILFLFVFILPVSFAETTYTLKITGDTNVDVGKTIQLTCTEHSYESDPSDGSIPSIGAGDVTSEVTWSSSDPSIATVSATGLVTGVKPGAVIIKAEYTVNPNTDSTTIATAPAEHSVTVKEVTPAVEWTDVSNVSFSISKPDSDFGSYGLEISGLSPKENRDYFVFVQNSSTLSADISSNPFSSDEKFFVSQNGTSLNGFINKNIETNGDIYVWLYERVSGFSDLDESSRVKLLISARKVERPNLRSLGLRMQAYFFSEYTSLFVKEFPISDGRKFHIKIGNIENNEILTAIRDGKAGSFASLLNYAKSDSSAFYDSAFSYNSTSTNKYNAISPNLPVVHNGFYYVYMYLEDEGGKYYPLEDIGLYQGCVSESIGKNMWDYYTQKDKFNWDALGSETPGTSTPTPAPTPTDPTQATTALPDTGKELLIAILVSFAAIGAGSYIIYRKYKDV